MKRFQLGQPTSEVIESIGSNMTIQIRPEGTSVKTATSQAIAWAKADGGEACLVKHVKRNYTTGRNRTRWMPARIIEKPGA